MEEHEEKNDQTDRTTVPVQNNTRNPPDQEVLETYQRVRGKRDMQNMRRNGIDEPHTN